MAISLDWSIITRNGRIVAMDKTGRIVADFGSAAGTSTLPGSTRSMSDRVNRTQSLLEEMGATEIHFEAKEKLRQALDGEF
jgi:hypothetical protein